MTEAVAGSTTATRKVGVPLTIGIVLAPVIFAWFLLRAGYSTTARVAAFVWMAAGLLVLVAAAGSGPNHEVATSSSAPGAAAQAPSQLRIGAPFQIGDIEVTVTGAKQSQRIGGEYLGQDAAEGGTLVLVTYTFKNTSQKPLPAYRFPDVKLVDDAGTAYSPDAGKTGAYMMTAKVDQKAFSDLNPGITVRNGQVFEVSAKAFDPAKWAVVVGDDANRVAMR